MPDDPLPDRWRCQRRSVWLYAAALSIWSFTGCREVLDFALGEPRLRIVVVSETPIAGLSATALGRSVLPWPIRDATGAQLLLISEVGLGGGDAELTLSWRVRGEVRSLSERISLGDSELDRCLALLRLDSEGQPIPQPRGGRSGGPSLLQWQCGDRFG